MVIQPKVRGFICTAAHPEGCEKVVQSQIAYVKSQGPFEGPKNVLVIGSSTGYGLASRIVATFGCQAKTVGVFYERQADDKRTASAGWYNTAAFTKLAHRENYYAKNINGDAFSQEIKQRTAELIRRDLKQVDLIVYSLAAPRRVDPTTEQVYSSVLKPIGKVFTSKTVDPFRAEVKEITLEAASQEDIANTIAVMGGDDWQLWIDYLAEENLLAPGIKTIAYSYIGPELTHPIYKDGTIGKAKEHLQQTARELSEKLQDLKGQAIVSVNKALVTQASAAIPVVPLYISLLFKLMKEQGTHEGCIEQIYRLYKDHLYTPQIKLDEDGFIRVDDLEMRQEIQQQISRLWPQINSENLNNLSDINGYCDEFYQLFGFNLKGVDYNADVNPHVTIPDLMES